MKHNILVIRETGKTGNRVVVGLDQHGPNVKIGGRKSAPVFDREQLDTQTLKAISFK